MTADVAGEPLSFDDAQILGLESDAIKGHTGKLLVLEPDASGALSASRLRDRVSERLRGLPRLRQRVEVPSDGGPLWVPADQVDLDWHVAEPRPAETLDEEGFRRLAGEILAERLDHSRPLWRLDLVALTGERTGLVGRIHHAMADGVSAIQIAAGLLWDTLGQEQPGGSTPAGNGAPGRQRPAPPGGAADPRRPAAEQH
ncbi:MAG: wax ester/triacylglycerol synthase domain-containing protein, partial [Solirubrobacterales bacterium]